jgi:hypothetical protein
VEIKESHEEKPNTPVVFLDADDVSCLVCRLLWLFEGRSLAEKTFSNSDTSQEDVSISVFSDSHSSAVHPTHPAWRLAELPVGEGWV